VEAQVTKAIIVAIFSAFAPMSLLMFGGANSIIPELHRQVVDVHAWMTSEEFATLFAVAQAAPGPNILIVSLIGWQVAGLVGLLAATIAINGPHCLLTYFVGGFIARGYDWIGTFKKALVPVTTGLILGSGIVMGRAADHDAITIAISTATAAYIVFSNSNPLWALAAAALTGILHSHASF
jgi:chromate transporter